MLGGASFVSFSLGISLWKSMLNGGPEFKSRLCAQVNAGGMNKARTAFRLPQSHGRHRAMPWLRSGCAKPWSTQVNAGFLRVAAKSQSKHPVDHIHDPVVVIVTHDQVTDFFDFGLRVSHRDGKSCKCQHLQVILRIPDSHCLLG